MIHSCIARRPLKSRVVTRLSDMFGEQRETTLDGNLYGRNHMEKYTGTSAHTITQTEKGSA